MRTHFLTSLVLGLLIGSSILYIFFKQQTIQFVSTTFHKPCSVPLRYRIGTIDPRFGLTKEDIVKKLSSATDLWNTGYGKSLFQYASEDESAMSINFVYDRRQQTLTLGSKIDSTEASQQQERAQIQAAQASLSKAQQDYAHSVDALNAQSEQYSSNVQEVNGRGGATPQEYAQLTAQKNALTQKQNTLRTQGDALTQQSNALQAMIEAFNSKVKDINHVVENYNATAGGDFEEGEFVQDSQGKTIYIYAYKNQNELLHSLAHELGHSLGLDHNQNPASIMFPYNKSGITLSADDLKALQTVCVGT